MPVRTADVLHGVAEGISWLRITQQARQEETGRLVKLRQRASSAEAKKQLELAIAERSAKEAQWGPTLVVCDAVEAAVQGLMPSGEAVQRDLVTTGKKTALPSREIAKLATIFVGHLAAAKWRS